VPNDPDLNPQIIEYLKKEYGDPKKIIFYERPFVKSLRQLWAGQGFKFGENNIKKYLNKYGLDVPVQCIDHHKSHAAYGYYTSTMKNAVIIVLDSIGEFDTISIWSGVGNKIQKRYSQTYPHSVGLFYSAMTQRCGFKHNSEEMKNGITTDNNENLIWKIQGKTPVLVLMNKDGTYKSVDGDTLDNTSKNERQTIFKAFSEFFAKMYGYDGGKKSKSRKNRNVKKRKTIRRRK
jgi:predicted NodU family carbamoyl transferase